MLPFTKTERHYVHGDLHEEITQTYYCAFCDQFVTEDHFSTIDHIKRRSEKYRSSLSKWQTQSSKSKLFRPNDAKNIIAEHAKTDEKEEKESRSIFFRWLLRQLKREDIIGDFAKDAKCDITFPRTVNVRKTLESHLYQKRASPETCVAFNEAWNEFKTKNKVRTGMSLVLRYAVLKRDSYRCSLCGATAQDNRKLEVDHKTPVAKGGSNEISNLWTLCFECNRGKGISNL